MGQKFSNNAKTLLAAGISAAATSLTVTAGDGDMFNVANADTDALPSVNDWYKVAITDVSGEVEFVAVRTRASGSDIMSNLVRALDGTTARDWGVGAVVVQALSSADVQSAFGIDATLVRDWSGIPESPLLASAGNKTLTRADCMGQRVDMDGATVTIPAGVMQPDDVVVVYNNSATSLAIIKAEGVTLWWVGGANANRTLTQRGICTIACVAANEFVITGQGLN